MAPPAKVGRLMAQVIARGRLPFAVVDFPRYDETGEAAARVYLRPLTQAEQDLARANAAAYVAHVLSGKQKTEWRPEELEDNAVAAEMLAVSCRDPDDPAKPFFEYGVVETRECTTDELSMLFQSYNAVREKAYPSLREMSEEEMWRWVRVLEEDAQQFPFSRVSRSRLEAFSVWAARSLASLLAVSGTTSNSLPRSLF